MDRDCNIVYYIMGQEFYYSYETIYVSMCIVKFSRIKHQIIVIVIGLCHKFMTIKQLL